jgi:hypothetical protein
MNQRTRSTTSLLGVSLLAMAPLCVPMANPLLAQEGTSEEQQVESTIGPQTDEDAAQAGALAKAAQNPIAALVSLPFQYNVNSGVGEFDRQQTTLNIQPVIPFKLSGGANLVTRAIIPVSSVPIGETQSEFGIGDVQWTGFYSPQARGGLSYGIGAQINLPWASNAELLGSGKFSAGPSMVFFYGSGKWTLGAVASNVWSFASTKGNTDREDVNFFFAQWFVNYNFGRGLALGTAPIVTCDWEYKTMEGVDDDQCTFPLGLQISKVTYAGSQPFNILLGYYENVYHPVAGAESQFRLQINFMFPIKPKG